MKKDKQRIWVIHLNRVYRFKPKMWNRWIIDYRANPDANIDDYAKYIGPVTETYESEPDWEGSLGTTGD